MKPVTWFKGTTGLNNVDDPTRLTVDFEKGIVELAEAVNVDVDRTGRVSRVKGYTLRNSSNAHSLWSDGVNAFYVSGGSLYRLNSNWTGTGIRSGLTVGERMSFAQAGGKVYYSNGLENGVIVSNTSSPWIGSAYVGHETIYEVSLTPPVGSLLEVHNGFMLIAEGSNIWWSMPFAYSWYRKSKDRAQLTDTVRMMKSVGNGAWVSDLYGVYWLEGRDPNEWTVEKVSKVPAVPGTECVTYGYELPDTGDIRTTPDDKCVVWMGADGLYLGTSDGKLKNLTREKLVYPVVTSGAGVVFNKKYVCSMIT